MEPELICSHTASPVPPPPSFLSTSCSSSLLPFFSFLQGCRLAEAALVSQISPIRGAVWRGSAALPGWEISVKPGAYCSPLHINIPHSLAPTVIKVITSRASLFASAPPSSSLFPAETVHLRAGIQPLPRGEEHRLAN